MCRWRAEGEAGHNAQDWRRTLQDRAGTLDFNAVAREVAVFLEYPEESALLTREHVRSVL